MKNKTKKFLKKNIKKKVRNNKSNIIKRLNIFEEMKRFIYSINNKVKYCHQLLLQVTIWTDGRIEYRGKNLVGLEQNPYEYFLSWCLGILKYGIILSLITFMYQVGTWYSYGLMASLIRWISLDLIKYYKEIK